MTTSRRIKAVAKSLGPHEAVLQIIAEGLEYASLPAYTRALVEKPISAAPLTRIIVAARDSVEAQMRGQSRDAIREDGRRAQGEGIFTFMLFMGLNVAALEVAKLEGLRATAVFLWAGCLLGGPNQDELEPAVWDTYNDELSGGWRSWTSVVEQLVWRAVVEREAREQLEKRYLAGRPSLFRDAAEQWADFEAQIGRLETVATGFAETKLDRHRPIRRQAPHHADWVKARADHLADDARIHALDRLDEQPRALAILERRFSRP